jgi:hypothetical protein
MKTKTNSCRSPLTSPITLAAVAGLAVASASHAANISWNGNVGNWGAGANWTGGNVPTNLDNTTIAQANAAVTLDAANATVRSLTVNNATAALNVNSKTLKTLFGSSVTAGRLNLNASNAGGAKLDYVDNFTIGNGGKIIMDAPATAGNVDLFGTLVFTLDFGAGSELNVNKGAGGKRTIFGNTRNAGVWKIDHDLLVDITAGGGLNNGSFENNGGDIRVNANAFFNVKGDDVDKCTFTFKGNGKLLTGKGTALESLTFDYQGGQIRNAADNARGGLTAIDSRLKLTSTNDVFITVNGLDSRIATSVKGAQQELYVTGKDNMTGANLTYEGNVKFENKGKISFATRANTNNIDFDGGGQVIENAGTMQTLGGGKVTLKGQVINKGTFSVQSPTRWEKANTTHVNDAGGTVSMDIQGALLELDNTMNNFGNINLGAGVKAATVKGVAAASNKMKNKATGKIQPGITNVGGLMPRPANDGTDHAFTLTGDTDTRSTGSSGAFSNPAVLTIDMGLDCEPGSAIESKLVGLSQSSFDFGRLDVIHGGLDLGGSTYNLFLEGFEPQIGDSFAVVRSDSFILNTFDFGNGVSDTLYPIGGSGNLKFHVAYNVPDLSSPGFYQVVLTAEAVPTPGTVTLLTLAGLTAAPRRRRDA